MAPRTFTDSEVDLLSRAAAQIGMAVDRARQHNVAELLQRTLLPARLPEVPAVQLAARYLPGADDTHVGGDWYDVVNLPEQRVGVAIGDVVSRGVRAAAVMGQMRTALRAYALDGEGAVPLEDGLRELARVAESLRGHHPEEVCDRLLRLATDAVVSDDVAMLALHVPAELAERLELTLPAEPGSLATLRRALSDWLKRSGVEELTGYDVMVATGEAAANAIEHAYGPGGASFTFAASMADGVLEVAIGDEGRWRPARGSHRGRGLGMMEQLMDDVKVDSGEGGTTVTMRRRLETDS
jgi:anti-sigma regulatory factor (Ser/Thr protein kinase)